MANVAKAEKANLPAVAADDFSDYAGLGLENVTARDVLVPRLTILQALSPQLNKRKPEYIPGSEVGDICDVGTGEVFKGDANNPPKIRFLPVLYRMDYLEWADRSSGGGLIAIHRDRSILDAAKNVEGKMILPNGNYIAETAQFFGFNLTAGGRKSFIPMASTGLKVARKWNTLATAEKLRRADNSTFVPPLFYRTYDLSVAEESNNKGSWGTWVVERGPTLQEFDPEGWKNIRSECVEFINQLNEGNLRGDLASANEESNSEAM